MVLLLLDLKVRHNYSKNGCFGHKVDLLAHPSLQQNFILHGSCLLLKYTHIGHHRFCYVFKTPVDLVLCTQSTSDDRHKFNCSVLLTRSKMSTCMINHQIDKSLAMTSAATYQHQSTCCMVKLNQYHNRIITQLISPVKSHIWQKSLHLQDYAHLQTLMK